MDRTGTGRGGIWVGRDQGVRPDQGTLAARSRSAGPRISTRCDLAILAALALATAAISTPANAQDIKPNQAWRVIESAHFRVTYAPGLDSLAARAAVAAESVRIVLTRDLGPPPAGKIDLVLSDDTDDSNGFAAPFPSNRVVLFAHPPADEVLLGDFDAWMHGLLAHELTHIWQMDRAGWAGQALRVVFGRLPSGWPLFPVIGAPNWFIEGNAVSYETELTGRGRLAGRVHEMMLRTALLEGHAEPYDRISNPTSSWPATNRAYAFGSLFVDHLARLHGPDVRAMLTARCAGAVVPPPLAFDRVAERTFRHSFSGSYRDWQRDLAVQYGMLRDSLTSAGLTATEVLAEGGAWSGPTRFSPDGRCLVYHRSDWRRPAMAVILDLESRREHDLWRHDAAANYAWLPGGDLVTAQSEILETYRSYSDLWRIRPDGRARQLTHGARLDDPDVCLRTGEAIAVENGRGTTRLVMVDLAKGPVIRRFPSPPEVVWAHPRWSPDGSRIAAERLSDGSRDIVVLDRDGNVRVEITGDRACDAYPAWSADGRFVVFASDRTGIWNLFAAAMDGPAAAPGTGVTDAAADSSGLMMDAAVDRSGLPPDVEDVVQPGDGSRATPHPRLQQVTNLLGGALQPDVSPDGKWIVFSSYHADGMRIERIPFDPAAWREAAATTEGLSSAAATAITTAKAEAATDARTEARTEAGTGTEAMTEAGTEVGTGTSSTQLAPSPPPAFTSRPYHAWRSLRPHYWMPQYLAGTETGEYYGLSSSGEDMVGLHRWSAWAVTEPQSGRRQGAAGYSWSGLGNPVLGFSGGQTWDLLRASYSDSSRHTAREREQRFAASATFRRPRRHGSAWFTLGSEIIRRRRIPDRVYADSLGDPVMLRYPNGRLFGFGGTLAYSNTSARFYSISPEDGVTFRLDLRRRWDLGRYPTPDLGDTETRVSMAAYRAVTRIAWSRAVLAARANGVVRNGRGASWADLGGVSEGTLNLEIVTFGGSRLLPLRGFPSGVRSGTRAWSAGLEWRMPLFLVERGLDTPPIFLERTWAVAFLDAGDAWAPQSQGGRQTGCGGGPCLDGYTLDPLVSAGAELALRGTAIHWLTVALRFGVARQLAGGSATVTYLALGGGGIGGTALKLEPRASHRTLQLGESSFPPRSTRRAAQVSAPDATNPPAGNPAAR